MKEKLRIKSELRKILFGFLVLHSSLSVADNLDELATSLISIRGEVEDLQTQLESAKQSHKLRLESLNSQLTDLNVENQEQTVAIEKLQSAITKNQQSTEASKQNENTLIPVVVTAVESLERVIKVGLPFKVDERLSALSEIKQQVNSNTLDAKKAANRLWAFIEDEIRLSRENSVYSQTINFDGEQRLVEVAKLGSIMMYFLASDNRVGKAVKKGDAWSFVEFTSQEDKEKIALLFDSLKKQIRQGYFELPNPKES